MRTILEWFWPTQCVLCGVPTTPAMDLCAGCHTDLSPLVQGCHGCSQPLNTDTRYCGACLTSPPAYDRCIALYPYTFPINALIMKLKFNQKLQYARVLGRLLADRVKEQYAESMTRPQAILPVPLHRTRLQERGFNQVLEIARVVAKTCEIRIDTHTVIREKATQAQALLPASLRQRNVRKAFAVDRQPKNLTHVALLDDVVTTGNTVGALTKTLKHAGVARVDVWCVARTFRK